MRRGLLAVFLFSAGPAGAQEVADDGSFTIDHPLKLLFAQTAKQMRFDGATMILDGMSPATLFFADRPQRLTGHFSNADFVELREAGQDSFAAEPPNAEVALLEEANKAPLVVELESVSLVDKALHYKVKVLEGESPAESGPVSLFIDHHHHHWGGFGFGWGRGFGPWAPGFGPSSDSGFSSSPFGCGSNGLFGSAHGCY